MWGFPMRSGIAAVPLPALGPADFRRRTERPVSVDEFEPVKTSRLRLTVWADLGGWKDLPMVKAVQAYWR